MFLYHASQIKNLKIIKPQRTLSNNQYIGDFVFATKDIKLATMYLATKGLYTLMETDNEPHIVIVSDVKDYLKNDKGGAIYTLPSEGFIKTPQKGLEKYELVSKKAIKPVDIKVYAKSLDAMKEMGIKIYFVDMDTFNKINQPNKGQKIISSLKSYKY